jgi:fatty-acyl-CoA synthase
LWLVNRIEWLALLFGAARLGAAVVAVNTRFRASELEYLLERASPRLLVLQHNFRKIDFPAVLDGVDPGAARSLERVAVIEPDAATPSRILGKPTVGFDAFDAASATVADASNPEAVAAMFTTSGTTKGPKLVMHPQRTITRHALDVSTAFRFVDGDARLLAALPFCGVFGFCSTLAAIAAGAPVVLMHTFDAADAVRLVRRHAITHMFGSDEMYRRMLELAPGRDPFRRCAFADTPRSIPAPRISRVRAWERRIPLRGLYGSSEVQALFSCSATIRRSTRESRAAECRPQARRPKCACAI